MTKKYNRVAFICPPEKLYRYRLAASIKGKKLTEIVLFLLDAWSDSVIDSTQYQNLAIAEGHLQAEMAKERKP